MLTLLNFCFFDLFAEFSGKSMLRPQCVCLDESNHKAIVKPC